MRSTFASCRLLRLLVTPALMLAFIGCETTGDPWVDDIRFSSHKAQLRIDSKEREQASLQSWALDETIHLSEMRGHLRRAQRERTTDEATLVALDEQINRARSDLSQLETDAAATFQKQPEVGALRYRRDRLRAEVNELDLKLATILKHHYLPPP